MTTLRLLSGAPVSSGSFSRAFGASCATLTVPDRHATSRDRRIPQQVRRRGKEKRQHGGRHCWRPKLPWSSRTGRACVPESVRAQLADFVGAPAASRASLPWPREKSWRRCPWRYRSRNPLVRSAMLPAAEGVACIGCVRPPRSEYSEQKYRVTSLNLSGGRLKRHQRCVTNSGTHELMGLRRCTA